MSIISRFIAAVTILLLALPPAVARAEVQDACGSMLMPAAQLKQVSRGFSAHHSGVDLTAPYGSPVRAALAGQVVFAGRYYGYGNMIDLRHADGTITRYGHLSAFAPGLRRGRTVATGEVIGRIGTSGLAHGPHLHFEVRVAGHAIDPKPYLALSACPVQPRAPLEEARVPDGQGRPGGLFQ
jgi:murein DD-endopeptidase MepM/ murein hydrolase activator NlpD